MNDHQVPWHMRSYFGRSLFATQCRVQRYNNHDIVRSRNSSIATASRCCSINDSDGCGAPLIAKATDLSVSRAVLRLAMALSRVF